MSGDEGGAGSDDAAVRRASGRMWFHRNTPEGSVTLPANFGMARALRLSPILDTERRSLPKTHVPLSRRARFLKAMRDRFVDGMERPGFYHAYVAHPVAGLRCNGSLGSEAPTGATVVCEMSRPCLVCRNFNYAVLDEDFL